MPQNPKEFPDLSNKLSAPNKKSVFERQRAEAEAKRLKEEQETAAVYADFVKSFDDESGGNGDFSAQADRRPAFAPQGGFKKRHFTSSGPSLPNETGFHTLRTSGPGSLGPASASVSRKRALDGSTVRSSEQSMRELDDSRYPVDAKRAFQDSDDEKDIRSKEAERVASKPTLYLSSLPRLSSASMLKSILPSSIKVESIRFLPPSTLDHTERNPASALITLAQDTPAADIDTTVSTLQHKYLGWGCYLNISRHLSSAAQGAMASISRGPASSMLPFAAKAVSHAPMASLSRAPPPPSMGRNFGPPASYGPSMGEFGRDASALQVDVKPPSDLKQLKLIHKTVENVISHGPEFEALLMERPSVQRDEKWAWLWDPRSVGGIWYRWRLWDVLTSAQIRVKHGRGRNDNSSQHVFEGGALWAAQERALPFEYDSHITEFVSESEYDSSEDEDSGDEGRIRLNHLQGGSLPPDQSSSGLTEGPSYLNPFQKAKLVHLLARLPTTTAKLRRGDLARITAFAIRHAGEGAEEVVDLITRNVHSPFTTTAANPEHKDDAPDSSDNAPDVDKDRDSADPSSMKLIALYVISDILSSASTSGVRHAWRYRQLFENSLRQHATFASLGRLEKDLLWGRLRAEKFKRSVNGVLGLWEGWCVFPAAAHEQFVMAFNEPPLTEKEQQESKKKELESDKKKKAASKWRTVDDNVKESPEADLARVQPMDVDEVDGEPMAEDIDDFDGEPMLDEEDVDGDPMTDDEDSGVRPVEEESPTDKVEPQGFELGCKLGAAGSGNGQDAAKIGRMQRPKAEDMFADSDEE